MNVACQKSCSGLHVHPPTDFIYGHGSLLSAAGSCCMPSCCWDEGFMICSVPGMQMWMLVARNALRSVTSWRVGKNRTKLHAVHSLQPTLYIAAAYTPPHSLATHSHTPACCLPLGSRHLKAKTLRHSGFPGDHSTQY